MFESLQGHGPLTSEFTTPARLAPPNWLEEARSQLPSPGHYLVLRDNEEPIEIHRVEHGWTRIGRSVSADIRLDHPSVSRRHALLIFESGKPIRLLDDRSLNGVFLNGEVVEWERLADGDELTIGRYRLFLIER